jgi:predicted nucleic acid-binding protein
MIILDTNVLSAAMQREPVVIAWLNRQARTSVWTTAITVLEIRFGLDTMPVGRRRTERQTAFALALEEKLEGRVLPLDEQAAQTAGSLMATRQRAGRPRELRDSMIAGIALSQRATLATRNARHFDDLNVPVLDPWQDR